MAAENKNKIDLITGTSTNRYSTAFESEILTNALIIPAQSQSARSPKMFVPRLGKESKFDIAHGKGVYYSDAIQRIILVTSTQILAIDPAGWSSKVLVNFDNEITTQPLFVDNYDYAHVWCENRLWSIDASVNASEITSDNLGTKKFNALTFLDGYVIASQFNSKQFLRSELNGVLWNDGLNYVSMQINDRLANISVLNRELYIFLTKHAEVWYNAGSDPNTPFVRQDGRISPLGTNSVNSLSFNGTIYNSVSSDDNTCGAIAWNANGYTNIGYDYLNAKIATAVRVFVSAHIENNQSIITYNVDGEYYCYHADTKTWHMRTNWDIVDTFSIGGTYYGLDATGIFLIAGTTDRGTEITCSKTSSVIHNNEQRLFHKLLELDVGGEIINKLRLAISDDGAKSWRNHAFLVPANPGQYQRVRFNRLGSSRSRVYKITWAGGRIYDAYLDLEPGSM